MKATAVIRKADPVSADVNRPSGLSATITKMGGAAVVVDPALDPTSSNPVENKAIVEALALKADIEDIPTAVSDLTNDSGFVNATQAANAAPVQSVNGQTGAVSLSIPTKTSQLTNDAGFINAKEVPVTSVNGLDGDVVLKAKDVGAIPDTTVIPTKVSQLSNDSGFITGINSTDVTNALGFTPYNATNPNGYVDATGANEAAIFWATYGTTTFAQLQAAWDAGKQILCFWSNRAYNLIYVGTSFTFGYVWGSTTYRLVCSSGSAWSNTSQTMQDEVTASGILKGNGSGGVSAAVGGTDYARMSDLPSVPSNVSAFNNDAGYLTLSTLPIYNGGVS